MNQKKFLGIFDKRPLIWFHYVLLTLVLFSAFEAASISGFVSSSLFDLTLQNQVFLFIWYFLFISIGDQIIHSIIGVD